MTKRDTVLTVAIGRNGPDGEHEPVFNTPNDDRPKPVTAATYAPTHGGYPG